MEKPAAKSVNFKALLPEVWALMKPRRGILALGAVLMVINRLCGLALPVSTKYLINTVMLKHEMKLLVPIVLTVAGATLIQGVTSFSLTQLLSKAGQRLIKTLQQAQRLGAARQHPAIGGVQFPRLLEIGPRLMMPVQDAQRVATPGEGLGLAAGQADGMGEISQSQLEAVLHAVNIAAPGPHPAPLPWRVPDVLPPRGITVLASRSPG